MTHPYQARPTYYDGIKMRSRLEAKVAALLDYLEVGWVYEPFAVASGQSQWLPDFGIPISWDGCSSNPEKSLLLVEVKPTYDYAMKAKEKIEAACAGWSGPYSFICPDDESDGFWWVAAWPARNQLTPLGIAGRFAQEHPDFAFKSPPKFTQRPGEPSAAGPGRTSPAAPPPYPRTPDGERAWAEALDRQRLEDLDRGYEEWLVDGVPVRRPVTTSEALQDYLAAMETGLGGS